MKNLPRPIVFALGAVTMMIVSGTAYAATGGNFLLGKSNSASTMTSLTNSAGTALSLNSKSGTAPLAVNSGTKVTNLNADSVDGVSSGSFSLKAGKTGIRIGDAGDSDGFVNTATCPSGTYATGGGGMTFEENDELEYSGPDFGIDGDLIPNSWLAIASEGAVGFVVCYNPRGSVSGADTQLFSFGTLSAESRATSGAQKPLG